MCGSVHSQCILEVLFTGNASFWLHHITLHVLKTSKCRLKWTRVKAPQVDLKMSLLIWCMLVLFLCASSKEMVLDKNRPPRWRAYGIEKGRNFIQNLKRHSDGTFTSDFTNYRDKIKAKDFVEWLASTTRNRCLEDLLQLERV